MKLKIDSFNIQIENLLIIIWTSFWLSDKIRMFLTSYFICYLFILFHELSHIMIASIYGKQVRIIKLTIAGVCVTFDKYVELNINKDLCIYFAGPISNIVLALLFYDVNFIFEINIFLAILNMIPIYPLDGYNILKCILEKYQSENYMNLIQNIFLSGFLGVSVYILISYYNPSLMIFFVYIMLIKYDAKNK